MDHGYKDRFTTACKFSCYSVLAEASYDYVLPPPEGQGKLTYFMHFPQLPVEAALSINKVRFFVKNIIFETGLIKLRKSQSTPIHKLSTNDGRYDRN
jgi:hypothetical protein